MSASPAWWFTFCLVLCFSLATRLQVWFQNWAGNRSQSTDILSVLMGDGRRLFANQFFTEADVYFHGGYYPSIFDNVRAPKKMHVSEEDHQDAAGEHEEHADMPDFLQQPANWIDRFGRYFYPTKHIHIENKQTMREILPWLLLSAELNPHRPQTYTVAAYWLRTSLGKIDEAETFLREGWKNNPESYEILFELGRLLEENRHDTIRARNVFEAALRFWHARNANQTEPDVFGYAQITGCLAKLEEREGHWDQAIAYFKMLQKVSPNAQAIQRQIDELQAKLPRK